MLISGTGTSSNQIPGAAFFFTRAFIIFMGVSLGVADPVVKREAEFVRDHGFCY
jgi:hypothetical protein